MGAASKLVCMRCRLACTRRMLVPPLAMHVQQSCAAWQMRKAGQSESWRPGLRSGTSTQAAGTSTQGIRHADGSRRTSRGTGLENG